MRRRFGHLLDFVSPFTSLVLVMTRLPRSWDSVHEERKTALRWTGEYHLSKLMSTSKGVKQTYSLPEEAPLRIMSFSSGLQRRGDRWRDEAAYGSRIVMRDIPHLGYRTPHGDFLGRCSK